MRLVLLLLVVGLLTWGVLQVLGDDGGEIGGGLGTSPPEHPYPGPAEGPPRPRATTGVLEVTVTSRSGHVPSGAEAGYRYGVEERWRKVDELGRALFTDAPLGKLEVLGRAPGFAVGSQERYVNAGLRLSVLLRLEKADEATPDR